MDCAVLCTNSVDNKLGDENMKHLLYAMEMGKIPCLRKLNLSGIPLKNNPSMYMASCIRANAFKFLECLFLENCELNPTSLEHISKAMVD